jgi:hypothetical protein
MEINFYTNGNDIFRSKAAKKKLRTLLKNYSFIDLKTYWNKFRSRCEQYLNSNVTFKVVFTKNNILELHFNVYKSEQEKEKELNRIKLRKVLAEKRKNRTNRGKLETIDAEYEEWKKDTTVDQEELILYFNARREFPDRYIPDPLVINKAPRLYIHDFIELLKGLDKENPNSKLVYEFDPYVIYMRKLLDMEDENDEDEIEI